MEFLVWALVIIAMAIAGTTGYRRFKSTPDKPQSRAEYLTGSLSSMAIIIVAGLIIVKPWN